MFHGLVVNLIIVKQHFRTNFVASTSNASTKGRNRCPAVRILNNQVAMIGGTIKGKSQKMKKAKTGGGSPPYLGPITLNNPWSILKKKKRHWHFTFTRFSTMDQKKKCMLTR